MSLIRNRLWLWGHSAGAHNGQYHLPADSRMTPVEAAYYLGISNLIMVNYADAPRPPFAPHMIAFRPLKHVVWSAMGDSSSTQSYLDEVLDLAAHFPNLHGAILDDFFHAPDATGTFSRLQADDLLAYQRRLHATTPPLDLFVVVYAQDLELPIRPYLEYCDVATFWTWRVEDLPNLEHNFTRLEAAAPDTRLMLGCYLWDFGAAQPMPLELMQHQCLLGRRLLREGRIEGMIFLSNTVCDLELDTVEWVRQWIRDVGDNPVR